MLQKMCHWCFYLNCLTWRTSLALVLTPTRFEGDRVGDLDGDFEGDLVGLSGTIVPDEFDDVLMSVAVVDDVRVVVAALEVLELIEPLWTSDSCFRRRPRFLGSAESPGTNNIKQFFGRNCQLRRKVGANLCRVTISETRFGEISPLWQNFDSFFLFGKMLSVLWHIW